MVKFSKKVLNIMFCITIICTFFFNIKDVNAIMIGTLTSGKNVRESYHQNSKKVDGLDAGAVVTVLQTGIEGAYDSGCNNPWLKVTTSNGITGYICSSGVNIENIVEVDPNGTFEQQMKQKKFPDSYLPYLKGLHEQHPNWQFNAINTNLDWNYVVDKEIEYKYINGSSEGYRRTDPGYYNYKTDTFTPTEGSTWYSANRKVIEYYLDPRTWLTENYAVMFESLKLESSYQTLDAVQGVLNNTFMSHLANSFYTSGTDIGISPIHIAAKSRQEVGVNGTNSTNGSGFTYNGIYYEGPYYNFYNIGAYYDGKVPTAVDRGLAYASGILSSDSLKTSYHMPWRTPEDAIYNGAKWIYNNYVNIGQNTLYQEYFNVKIGSIDPTHQYATNVKAHASIASSTTSTYRNTGVLDRALVLNIPVYNNMPSSTSLPNAGNPNNYLSDLKINGETVNSFDGDNTSYTHYVASTVSKINVSATSVKNKGSISGTGDIILSNGENKINVKVTAQNGDVRTYTVNVIKSSSPNETVVTPTDIVNNIGVKVNDSFISGINLGTNSDVIVNNVKKMSSSATVVIKDANGTVKSNKSLGTGDTVTITSGGKTNTYTVIIKGDVSGDSSIDIVDLLRVQKQILGSTTFSSTYQKAADVNNDGKVDIVDLLRVQKHILGTITISG
ncbi:MAG: SH3 domain-containing protein [Bacilli bacterium]|nr:SH3 domain-containing protein [Bacilli bacterium]